MPERISYATDDGIVIVGDWQVAPTIIGAVLLLHMMPETRASWAPFQQVLAKRGIASLAIDLRGFGESTKTLSDDVIDRQKFTDDDYQTAILDVLSGVRWLRDRSIDIAQISLVGASIGANLAIQAMGEEPKLRAVVALSAGADYHGLKAFEDMPKLLPEQAVCLVASEDDAESFIASKKLLDRAPVTDKIFLPYQTAGHGTRILQADPKLSDKLADWILGKLRG